MAGYVWSQVCLLLVTGEGRMADRLERAFFNAGPATGVVVPRVYLPLIMDTTCRGVTLQDAGLAYQSDMRQIKADAAWQQCALGDPALVVERFLPETEDGLYAVRSWVFLGPRGHATRRLSPRPVVRADAVVRREPISVPRDIEEDRARLAFDYGKLDFVLHGDRAILLDANRTPKLSGSSPSADALAKARNLALGVAAWLDSPEGRPLGGEPPPGREEKRRR